MARNPYLLVTSGSIRSDLVSALLVFLCEIYEASDPELHEPDVMRVLSSAFCQLLQGYFFLLDRSSSFILTRRLKPLLQSSVCYSKSIVATCRHVVIAVFSPLVSVKGFLESSVCHTICVRYATVHPDMATSVNCL